MVINTGEHIVRIDTHQIRIQMKSYSKYYNYLPGLTHYYVDDVEVTLEDVRKILPNYGNNEQ